MDMSFMEKFYSDYMLMPMSGRAFASVLVLAELQVSPRFSDHKNSFKTQFIAFLTPWCMPQHLDALQRAFQHSYQYPSKQRLKHNIKGPKLNGGLPNPFVSLHIHESTMLALYSTHDHECQVSITVTAVSLASTSPVIYTYIRRWLRPYLLR